MTDLKTKLKALIDAGDKATQGEWATESYCNGDRTPTGIGAIQEDRSVEYIFEVLRKRDDDAKPNCAFTCLAANARPMLKEVLAELEKWEYQREIYGTPPSVNALIDTATELQAKLDTALEALNKIFKSNPYYTAYTNDSEQGVIMAQIADEAIKQITGEEG